MRWNGKLGLLAVALTGLLASCGGGGDADPPATITAHGDAVELAWNSPVTVDVLANDAVSRGAAEIASITSPPAHGTAVVSAGKVVYTPAAGYLGEDGFSYSARAAEGGALSSAEVKLTISASLKLEGRVAPPALAGASIVITAGDHSIQANADANGAFTAALASSHPADMIRITATGAGAKTKVKVISLVGEFGTLARRADSRASVSADRVPALNVSALSSAVAALVIEANGGQPPATEAALQSLTVGLPPQRVIDLATVLSMVADGTVALPEAAADTLALIQQPATPAYKALVRTEADSADFHWNRYMAARQAVTSSAVASAAPAIAGSAPEDRAYVAAFRAASPPGAMFVSYRPDGTATIATSTGARTATWKRADGTLRITLDAVLPLAWYDVDPNTLETLHYRDDITGYAVRQFAGDARSGMAVINAIGSTLALDGPAAGTRQPIADSGTVASVIDPSLAPAWAASDFAVGSRWAGVVLDADFLNYATAADTLEITGATTARYARTGGQLEWSLSNGWLRLAQGSVDRRYLRLSRNATSGEEHWLVADFEGGKILRASEALVIKATAQKFVPQPELFRRWQPGTDDLGAPWVNYFFDIRADGKARFINAVAYGDEWAYNGNWTLDGDGTLGMTLYNNSGRVYNTRSWSLVARTASQFYVMERVQYASGETWRLNVYTDAGPAAP